MKFYRLYALLMRHLYLYKRSLPRLMDLFFWPILEILVWGFLSVYLEKSGLGGVNIVSLLLGAIIFWDLLSQSQKAVSFAMMEEVWEKNFLNIFVTPMRISEFLASTFLLGLIRIIICAVVLGIGSLLLYKFNILQFGLYTIPFMINLLLFGWTLGIMTTSVTFRFGSGANIIAFTLIFILQPFSAVFYPISALPHFLQYFAYILPSAYVFEGMRDLIHTGVFNVNYFLLSTALNIFYVGLISFLFYRAFYWVKINGKIMKLEW
ncbi:MAG TPA: ABC transporter permease [Candidatus Paceibacterota bacterium]|nr:ABC transporter permease [Candidatus Paceibacterota bacterium]